MKPFSGYDAAREVAGASGPCARDRDLVVRRLRAFFGAMAPLDEERLEACVRSTLDALPPDVDVATAVAHAQARLVAWWSRTFSMVARGPSDVTGDPHARRAVTRMPHLFLSEDPADVAALRRLREQLAENVKLPAQELGRSRPRALLAVVPALALGAAAAWVFARALDAPPVIGEAWALLLGLLTVVHAGALTLASIGVVARLRRRPDAAPRGAGSLPRTAILMPICEEDPERVFGAIAAMRDALLETGRADAFAFYVLSDTQDALKAADEERAWRRLAATCGGHVPIYYRRRAENVGRKVGNLAEFAVRHGPRFEYAVMLDADSLMGAGTIVAAIERMEADPRLGLLQAPVELRGGVTPFARALQFAHAVSGPILFSGLAAWSGRDGNYFGHNAVVRLKAFTASCGLPALDGPPPLGGPILSHDFVEAALLQRAGWDVRLADDLVDSYEEPPATLSQYLTRDRRWCQGNLQHLRLLATRGFTWTSRLHLLSGALAYLLSPLWLCFVALGVVVHVAGGSVDPHTARGLTALAVAVLLAPRLLGLLEALLRRRARFGGALRLLVSSVAELVLSALLAPLVMIAHTAFVLEIVSGRAVDWKTQRRSAGGEPLDRRLLLAAVAGLVAGGVLCIAAPHVALATAPIWIPWALAPAIGTAVSSPGFGAVLKRLGLFSVPVELARTAVVRGAERNRDLYRADETARFRDVVLDPVLNAQRRRQLAARGVQPDPALAALADRAIVRGPAALSPQERARLLDDAAQLARLHDEAWRTWPVESWSIPRQVRAEPGGEG